MRPSLSANCSDLPFRRASDKHGAAEFGGLVDGSKAAGDALVRGFREHSGLGELRLGLPLDVSTRPFNHLGNPLVQLAMTQLTAAFFGEFALAALRVRAKGRWRLLFWGGYLGSLVRLVFGPGGFSTLCYGATLSAHGLFGLAVSGGGARTGGDAGGVEPGAGGPDGGRVRDLLLRAVRACAGQMGPHLDEVEVAVETGLPRGIIRDAEFAETTLTLGAGQQLTLVSDWVVEAAKAWGRMTTLPW